MTHEAAKQSDTATSISLPYTGDGDTSIAAITDDDISRIVDQLAERLELPVSPAKPPPGGQAVLAQPVPALVAPPPMDVPHQSATRALTPSQRTKIGKMLAKSKLEAMETMSIAFTNVHGYGGAEDDIDQDIDRVRVDDAPPPAEISGDTSTSVEQFIQNHLASKSTELLERHRSRPTAQRAVHAPKKARPMNKRTSRGQPVDVTSNFDRAPLADHSHMFKQLPTVARPPSAQKPPQRRASTATGSDVSSVNSVYLFRDDTSMVTSLADLVDELENGDSSGAISGGNVAILGMPRMARWMIAVYLNLSLPTQTTRMKSSACSMT